MSQQKVVIILICEGGFGHHIFSGHTGFDGDSHISTVTQTERERGKDRRKEEEQVYKSI